jgi:hypothetical protein
MTFTYEQLIWIPILVAVLGAGGIYFLLDFFFRWPPFDDDE